MRVKQLNDTALCAEAEWQFGACFDVNHFVRADMIR
jgi:hypothetical protein